MTSQKRILAIDGGGVRGLIPLVILDKLKKSTGKDIHKLFDVATGTSTGAIVALGLLVGKNNQPLYEPEDLMDLYLKTAKDIFSTSFWRNTKTGFGLWGSKYDSENLKDILISYFGGLRLSDLLIPVVITSYSLDKKKITLWSSEEAKKNPSKNFLLTDIALAASAAPTYFEPYKFNDEKGNSYIEVDGGIYANNPSMIGLSYTKQLYSERPINNHVVVSIGTGKPKAFIKKKQKKTFGIYEWVIHQSLIDIMINCDSDETNHVMENLCPDFYRLQVHTSEEVSMDETSKKKLTKLKKQALSYVKENHSLLKRVGGVP